MKKIKLYFTEIIIHYHQFTVVVVTTVIEYIFVYSLSTRNRKDSLILSKFLKCLTEKV